MTKKEAIIVIEKNWPPSNRTRLIEALTIAVKHLEQSSNSDKTICPECGSLDIVTPILYNHCHGCGAYFKQHIV